ncbi:hypothetical protein MHU86_13162 [Fragilaria crotonensis]|nr:hypothetical protein MHU86_13162 [Fragilaria crotonensis]
MRITYLLLQVLLASVTLVMSVDTSTYGFTFELAMTGPEGACSDTDLDTVATKLTNQVGFTINLFFSSQGYPGQVTNITLAPRGKARLLGEADNYEATAMDAFVDEQQSNDEGLRELLALYTWKTGGAAICRLCPPLDADARRVLRRLQTSRTVSKSKISDFLNSRITTPTQFLIKRLNTTNTACNESYEEWTTTFSWT